MVNSQKEAEDNYKSKCIIKEKKMMLRKILRLFPAGIMFYNKSKGFIYKNKFWLDLVNSLTIDSSVSDSLRPRRKQTDLDEDITEDVNIGDDDTHRVLDMMHLRDSKGHTLKDEIYKIHDHFYENGVQLQQINKTGVDDFIYRENLDFNEYEIKDKMGKQLCDFNAKFAAFNFSQDERSIMIVINDISERTRLRETKMSEMLKTIML